MSSNINTSKIDTNYPSPGKDNPTQGFRDNFEEIVKNINTAKEELSDLLVNSARTDQDVEFNTNKIINANLLAATFNVFDLGNIDTDTELDFLNGHMQILTITNDVNLSIIQWPQGSRYAFMRVALLCDETSRTVNWVESPNQTIKFDGEWPNTLTLSSSDDYVILEFFTFNGGETVYANFVGRYSSDKSEPKVIRDLTVDGNLTLASLVAPNLANSEKDSEEPVLGKIIYNTDTGKMEAYVEDNGSGSAGWVELH